jgi:hypothetical protein
MEGLLTSLGSAAVLALALAFYSPSAAAAAALEPPPDWAPIIARGDMAWTPQPPSNITPCYYPAIGNGFLAQVVGPLKGPAPPDYGTCGYLFLAGVHNGPAYDPEEHPSHRAAFPSFLDVTLRDDEPSSHPPTPHGAAVDFARGLYLNRTTLDLPASCPDTLVELRIFAHRLHRDLLVLQLTGSGGGGGGGGPANTTWAGCPALPLLWTLDLDTTAVDAPATRTPTPPSSPLLYEATTLVPEVAGVSPLVHTAIAVSPWVGDAIAAGSAATVSLTPSAPTLTALIVARSNLTDPDPAAAVLASFAAYSALSPDALLQEHLDAMEEVWASGIEVLGNASFGALVNSSLYGIAAVSLRADVPLAPTPGGLSGNAYGGHVFWDWETWQLPSIALLHPDLAAAAGSYRFARLPAALGRASARGYTGAMWPWQCSVTGVDNSRNLDDGSNEQHVTPDIVLGLKLVYSLTEDDAFLRAAWPSLAASCDFCACRFTRTDSPVNGTEPYPGPGQGLNCSSKSGTGNWTVRGVVPPDEAAGIIDDNAYTNGAFSLALAWCLEAASILNEPIAGPTAALWADMAAAPYMPLTSALYAGGPVHQEYSGYNGSRIIQQSDVALLQHPLGLDFGPEQSERDLDYWLAQTDMAGMYTGDTVYGIAYLRLGNENAAAAQFDSVFSHVDNSFLTFRETAAGGSSHFITGAGSFLQLIALGYGALVVPRPGVVSLAHPRPTVPSAVGATGLKLRGVGLSGLAFDVSWDNTTLCAGLNPAAAAAHAKGLRAAGFGRSAEGGHDRRGEAAASATAATSLVLTTVADGRTFPLVQGAAPVCVPVQAAEVSAVAGVEGR